MQPKWSIGIPGVPERFFLIKKHFDKLNAKTHIKIYK